MTKAEGSNEAPRRRRRHLRARAAIQYSLQELAGAGHCGYLEAGVVEHTTKLVEIERRMGKDNGDQSNGNGAGQGDGGPPPPSPNTDSTRDGGHTTKGGDSDKEDR